MSLTVSSAKSAPLKWPVLAASWGIVGGSSILIGWIFGLTWVTRFNTGFVPVHPNTAVAFVLVGFALLLRSQRHEGVGTLGRLGPWTSQVLALAVSALGGLGLLEMLGLPSAG